MAPPPSPPTPLSDHRRQFLSTLLDVSVRQLAWPDDAEWESRSSEEADLDDEIATFRLMRTVGRHTLLVVNGLTTNRHVGRLSSRLQPSTRVYIQMLSLVLSCPRLRHFKAVDHLLFPGSRLSSPCISSTPLGSLTRVGLQCDI